MKIKICFIGLGSIATRHINNLIDIYGDNVVIDALRIENKKPIRKNIVSMIHKQYANYEDLPFDYNVIFITNPTALHYETLQKTCAHAKSFFIEKPVFWDGHENIESLHLNSDSTYYVACPLRYMKVIQYLKHNIDVTKVHSVRSISSSYLPEWREGVDYRNTYSAKKSLGGGVSIDLIHEWDYLCYLFGAPNKICSIISKKSNLEIDTDDLAIYIAEYNDKCIEVHLDYFGRTPTRKLELFMEEDTVVVDLLQQTILSKKNNRKLDMNEDRNSYQKRELQHFFDIVNQKCVNDSTIEQACSILKITRGEER